jgi:hypothetical protein
MDPTVCSTGGEVGVDKAHYTEKGWKTAMNPTGQGRRWAAFCSKQTKNLAASMVISH